MTTLSLIVPAYNEAYNIMPFYRRVREVFNGTNYRVEILFIDDGSTDETAKRIENASDFSCFENQITVTGISFSRNFGKESAMLAGMKSCHGELISIVDADLQQDPSYVKQMADMLASDEETDCVTAVPEDRKEGRLQCLLKKAFYRSINKSSSVEFTEDASDFRTFRAAVKDAIISLPESRRFSKGLFSWVGFNTCYIPYQVKERENGTSSWSLSKLFRYAIDGFAAFSDLPQKIPFLISGVIFALALIFLVMHGLLFPGVFSAAMAAIIFFLLLLGSFQSLCTGMIVQYTARNLQEARHRPAYIIRRIYNADQKRRHIHTNVNNPTILHRLELFFSLRGIVVH
ncbi:MAG: glycosyltransferase family 2 protein [Anaerovoracaceae bacterium]|jgi:glucosyltransferase